MTDPVHRAPDRRKAAAAAVRSGAAIRDNQKMIKIHVTIGRRHAYNAISTEWRRQARRPEFREATTAEPLKTAFSRVWNET